MALGPDMAYSNPMASTYYVDKRPCPMVESEVIENNLDEVDWETLNSQEQKKYKNRLRHLQNELGDRLLKRRLPFRLTRFEQTCLWLQEPVGLRAAEETRRANRRANESIAIDQPMTLEECKRFLRVHSVKGRRETTALQQECKELDCRPGTFRRALKNWAGRSASAKDLEPKVNGTYLYPSR